MKRMTMRMMRMTKSFAECAWISAFFHPPGGLDRDSIDVRDDAQFEIFVKLMDFYVLDAIQPQFPVL